MKTTKRILLQTLLGAFSLPFAAKAAEPKHVVAAYPRRAIETGPPYGPHPIDLDPNRVRPERGQVLVTWTSKSGRQFTFDVDRQRTAMLGQADEMEERRLAYRRHVWAMEDALRRKGGDG